MHSSFFPVAAITVASQTVGWDYAWPYGSNHTCKCQEVPAIGEFFESKETCLEAYSKDQYQWCMYEGQGVDDSQCDGAVSIAEGVINENCGEKCTGVVAGTVSLDEFEEVCKFNFYADFGTEVAVGWQSCYSNMVYGWSDYNPQNPVQAAPIKVFSSVEGPTACQSLCQAVDTCVYWTWRAYADYEVQEGTFQNPPLTCLLYDQKYIDGVLSTPVPTSPNFATPTAYCNVDAIPDCLLDPFGRDAVPFLEPYSCLLCGCVSKCAWKSPYHLSGPAFCEPEYRDECSYTRPAWTSTLPPCDSGDVTSTTTVSLEESTTTTGIEIDESTTEGINVPSTMGTSTTTLAGVSTTAIDMDDSTTEIADVPSTMGTSTTTPLEGSTSDDNGASTTEMMNPSMTMGTTTPSSGTMEDVTTSAVNTMGTATTTRGASCPECDVCEDDCDEPEIYIDIEEPCDECMRG